MDKLERIQELVNILNKASYEYYNTGHPIMEDSEFDTLLDELQRLEIETNTILSNSPTINAGSKVAKEQKKITHEHQMLSLAKIHSIDEIRNFLHGESGIATIKLDGLTCSATYINGELTRLETRGNGEIGTDIMIHKNSIEGLPKKIEHNGKYVIDGECIVTTDRFEMINSTLSDDVKFSNPRNMASGSLNLLDSNISAKRGLTFVAWNVIEDSQYFRNNMLDNLRTASGLGFFVVPYTTLYHYDDDKTFEEVLTQMKAQAGFYGYPMDGVVFSFMDIEYGKSLGKTGHHFNHSVAYKYEDSDVETILKEIDWTMGKTGQLTPTAVFDTVELEGSQVNRASLHNISICKSLELGIGDRITVYKANMIIPQLRDNLTRSNNFTIPETCPICGADTEVVKDNDTKVLVCTNSNCKGKLLGKLSHFCSKNAMNIEGMSEATLQFLIDKGWVNSFKSIYHLEKYKEEWTKSDGFGKRSVEKLLEAIEKSRNATLSKFIYSLSIPMIGKSASKEIAKYFKNDFRAFWEAWNNRQDWRVLKDFGEIMHQNMTNFIENNQEMVCELMKEVVFEEVNRENNNSTLLDNKTFVITGTLNHYANRNELISIIELMGGKVSSSVSSKTSYLINNNVTSTSGKNKKAKELGIPIISEEDFIKMIS